MYRDIVGYRDFHPNDNFNFQLNRWLPYLPEDEIRELAGRISDYSSWKAVMLEHAQRAEERGSPPEAAFYYRAAEFFMLSSDPDKMMAYDHFVELHEQAAWQATYSRDEVPFGAAHLPVWIMEPQGELRDTVVAHGGFDSFAQELIHQLKQLPEHGFRVIFFEGPGQGSVLARQGVSMTPDWHEPVGAVLDHFAIEACTLLGISLGGCLATRAAAREPRVKRVIADDVLEDFFGCLAGKMGQRKARVLEGLLQLGASGLINRAMAKACKSDPFIAWAVDHGMHVSGTATPYDYLQWTRQMNTREVSSQLTQDYLLLAARDDHLVPLSQFYSQAASLTAVRSLTCRLFTAQEHAGSHCHIGNQGLVEHVMLAWLNEKA